jgi:hypothetical protein
MAKSEIWYIGKPTDQTFLESRVEEGLVCLKELPLTVDEPPRLIVLDLSCPAALEGLQQLTEDQEILAAPIVLLSKRRIGGAIAQAMLSPADIRWVVQSPLQEARIPESLELLLLPNADPSVPSEPDLVLSEEIEQELREALSQLEILEAESLEQREQLDGAEVSNQALTERADTVEAEAGELREEVKSLSEQVLGLERGLLDARTAGDHTRAQLDGEIERLEIAESEQKALSLAIEKVQADLGERDQALSKAVLLQEEFQEQRNQAIEDRRVTNSARLELESERDKLAASVELALQDMEASVQAFESAKLTSIQVEKSAKLAEEQSQERIVSLESDVETSRKELEDTQVRLRQTQENSLQNQKQLNSTKVWAVEVEQQFADAEVRLLDLEKDLGTANSQLAQNELKAQAALSASREAEEKTAEEREEAKAALVVSESQVASNQEQIVRLEQTIQEQVATNQRIQAAHDEQKSWAIEAEQRAAETEEQLLKNSQQAENESSAAREKFMADLASVEECLASREAIVDQLTLAAQEQADDNQRLQKAEETQKQRAAETEEQLLKNSQQAENESSAAREKFMADLASVEERLASREAIVDQLTLAVQEQSDDNQRLQIAEEAQNQRAVDAEQRIVELDQREQSLAKVLSQAEENLSGALAQVESETEKVQNALSVATKATAEASRFEQQASESQALAEAAKRQSEDADTARKASDLASEASSAARKASDLASEKSNAARITADADREAAESSLNEAVAAAAKAHEEHTARSEHQAERMLALEARCEEQEATLVAQVKVVAAFEEEIADRVALAERSSREWGQQLDALNGQVEEHRKANEAAEIKRLGIEKALDLKENAIEELNESMAVLTQEKADVVVQIGLLQESGLSLQDRLDLTQRAHESTQGELSAMVQQHTEQGAEISNLSDSLALSQDELRNKTAAEKEISMQLVGLESHLSQERSQVEALNLKLAETLELMEGQEQEAARVQTSLQQECENLKTHFDEASGRFAQAESELQEAMSSAIKTEREKAQNRVVAAVELANREAQAAADKRQNDFMADATLHGEVESLRNESKGLRESRDRLQSQLSQAAVQLDDEKERVRSATKAGVVWSARREPPKDESLLGKLKSPFKKG